MKKKYIFVFNKFPKMKLILNGRELIVRPGDVVLLSDEELKLFPNYFKLLEPKIKPIKKEVEKGDPRMLDLEEKGDPRMLDLEEKGDPRMLDFDVENKEVEKGDPRMLDLEEEKIKENESNIQPKAISNDDKQIEVKKPIEEKKSKAKKRKPKSKKK